MYDDILQKRSMYQQKIYDKIGEIEAAKLSNEERIKLLHEKQKLRELRESFDEYRYDVKKLTEMVEQEDREFKNRRILYINDLITESLQEIFPEERLSAELECDFYRQSEVSLVLRDYMHNEYVPDICSGKLQQYIISFAAVAGITKGLGIRNLYVDEAFGVAAPAILGDLGEFIKKIVDDGMQVIMIAQNPGLYQGMPRREISLRKNSGCVVVESETDY